MKKKKCKIKRIRILEQTIEIVLNEKINVIAKETGVNLHSLYKYLSAENPCPDDVFLLLQNYSDSPLENESEDESHEFFKAAYNAVIRKRKIDQK